jgi:hypothetical protein
MRILALLPALLLAVALGGCTAGQPNRSAGSFEGAERDVAQVIDDLKASRDPEEVCSRIFADVLAKSLAADGRDCAAEVDAMLRDVGDTDLQVRDVAITGTMARAQVRQGDDGETATFELARARGGGWQITSLGAPG